MVVTMKTLTFSFLKFVTFLISLGGRFQCCNTFSAALYKNGDILAAQHLLNLAKG